MIEPIKLLDVVALTIDSPEFNLYRGQVGTVVEILAEDTAFEVEFSDRNGRTFESLGLTDSVREIPARGTKCEGTLRAPGRGKARTGYR